MRREVRRLAASETARKHATQFLWSYIFHYDFLGFWYGAPKPYEFRHRFHVEIWRAHLERNHGCCDLLGRARCETPWRCSRAKPDHISVGTRRLPLGIRGFGVEASRPALSGRKVEALDQRSRTVSIQQWSVWRNRSLTVNRARQSRSRRRWPTA